MGAYSHRDYYLDFPVSLSIREIAQSFIFGIDYASSPSFSTLICRPRQFRYVDIPIPARKVLDNNTDAFAVHPLKLKFVFELKVIKTSENNFQLFSRRKVGEIWRNIK